MERKNVVMNRKQKVQREWLCAGLSRVKSLELLISFDEYISDYESRP